MKGRYEGDVVRTWKEEKTWRWWWEDVERGDDDDHGGARDTATPRSHGAHTKEIKQKTKEIHTNEHFEPPSRWAPDVRDIRRVRLPSNSPGGRSAHGGKRGSGISIAKSPEGAYMLPL